MIRPLAARASLSLRPSLELVCSALSPALFSADAVARLMALADKLPPIHRAGFECRLDEHDMRVDLQQGVIPSTWEPRALSLFAREQSLVGHAPARAAWATVERLAEAWQTGDRELASHIGELWLEFDVDRDGDGVVNTPGNPSVFVILDTQGARTNDPVIGLLLDSRSEYAIQELLERWRALLAPMNARVSHFGVMLGRSLPAVRIHVSALQLSAVAAFLSSVAWAGDADGVVENTRMLLDYADTAVLCFDVVCLPSGGVHLLPRIGIEAFFAQKTGVDPRWVSLLQALAERGLASPSKAEALLRWPGEYTPINAPAPWPDDLIIRSLATPASIFGRFERRLSHVKLSLEGTLAPAAKAYFGYGHLWTGALTTTAAPPGTVPVTANAEQTAGRTLDDAIARAEHFLLAARNQAGWWRDFYDLARSPVEGVRVTGYSSDEWVTAYTGAMLATSPRAPARQAALDAWSLLEQRRDDASGWGYHAQLPPDADSTSWALRLAAAVGARPTARTTAAHEFLAEQTRQDGGVVCYRASDCPSIAAFLAMDGPYDGWCTTHTCVTASVAALGRTRAHYTFLRNAQQSDGRWTGHWWDDDEYATAMAVLALSGEGSQESQRAVEHGARWAAERISASGAVHSISLRAESPFATALALQAALAGSSRDVEGAPSRASRWLIAAQREDGSFMPSARLRVPAPDALDPLANPERTISYLDRDAIFTTATVYAALVAYKRALDEGRQQADPSRRSG